MESPVLTLVVALFFAVNVESQRDVIPPPREFSFPPPPPPPSPPPPRLTPPPPIPQPPPSTPHTLLRPPPLTPTQPPFPFSRSPSPRLQLPPPPWLPLSPHIPPPRKQLQPVLPEHGNQNSNKNLSPPLERAQPNMGKKIGLMFIGVAAILQFCILAFLLIRRRQLLKSENGY